MMLEAKIEVDGMRLDLLAYNGHVNYRGYAVLIDAGSDALDCSVAKAAEYTKAHKWQAWVVSICTVAKSNEATLSATKQDSRVSFSANTTMA